MHRLNIIRGLSAKFPALFDLTAFTRIAETQWDPIPLL